MTSLLRNQVIEWWTPGKENELPRHYRILHVNRVTNDVEVFDLTAYFDDDEEGDDKQNNSVERRNEGHESSETTPAAKPANRVRKKFFITIDLPALEAALREQRAHVIDFLPPAHVLTHPDDLTEDEKRIRDDHWKIIKPLVEGDDAELIFNRDLRGSLVSERAKAMGKGAPAVYCILYRYFANGMTKNALIPGLRKRGGPGKVRKLKSTGAKMGTPRRPGPHDSGPVPQGRNTDETDQKRFQLAFARYIAKQGMSQVGAHQQMLVDIYKVGAIVDGKFRFFDHVDPHRVPTLRQFRYALDTRIDPQERLRKQTSEKRYNLKHRQLGGRPRADKFGPGEQYETDSTPTRVSLISDLEPDRILGLATIYTVFDTWSQMVVGGAFSWRPPSWEIAREALFNACTSKVEFCQRYSYVITEETWPCHHVPYSVLADRQELLSADAQEVLMNGLNIATGIAPPGRPDFKSYVERNFGLIEGRLEAESMEGAAPAGLPEPGTPNPKLKSIMTLDEFAALYLRAVVDYNHHFEIKEGLPMEAIKDGVRPYPIQLWNWGLANGIGSPQKRTPVEIYLHLLPREKATIERDGIYLSLPEYKKKLRYTCERAGKEQWFAKARNFGRETINVSYEPGWTNHIWLSDGKGGLERGDLLDGEEAAKNRRVEEVLAVFDRTYTPTPQEKHASFESSLGLRKLASDTLKKATARAKAHRSGKSNRQRLAGMRDARKLEGEIERAQRNQHMAKVLDLSDKLTPPAAAKTADKDPSKAASLDLFRQARDKALGERK